MNIHNNKEMCQHNAPKWEYRIVKGTYYEGLSIREVYLDKNNKIIGWSKEPIFTQGGFVKDIIADIVEGMYELENMLEATKKEVLIEDLLEETVK